MVDPSLPVPIQPDFVALVQLDGGVLHEHSEVLDIRIHKLGWVHLHLHHDVPPSAGLVLAHEDALEFPLPQILILVVQGISPNRIFQMGFVAAIGYEAFPGFADGDFGFVLGLVRVEVEQEGDGSDSQQPEFILGEQHHAVSDADDDVGGGVLVRLKLREVPLAERTDPDGPGETVADAQHHQSELHVNEHKDQLGDDEWPMLSRFWQRLQTATLAQLQLVAVYGLAAHSIFIYILSEFGDHRGRDFVVDWQHVANHHPQAQDDHERLQILLHFDVVFLEHSLPDGYQ